NMPFDEALALAQKLGYAEKDPTADIEGHDACRKICIISSLVFGKHVYPDSVFTKGISDIQLCDVSSADMLGYSIKLIATVSRNENGKILPVVMPMLVPSENIIAGVIDVFNAVLVYGDGIDQTMFYGRGAGKLPTASAVLGDVIESVKHNVTVFSQSWESAEDDSFIDTVENFKARWYLRTPSANTPSTGIGDTYDVHEDGSEYAFVTEEVLTFAQVKNIAEEVKAIAVMPVLD
ncbi:MAG: homoserine dehydrogenase, partial [Ruminococcus sp.]|nr:homoserine dehydrogenase [Ruminococcus sp.]